MDASDHQTIHNIPNELLTKVFTSITLLSLREWSESYAGSGNPWGLPFPMLASSVCRHWRAVAISSPELWSTIYVPFFVSARSLLTDPVKFTSLWLTRSKAAALDVFLSVPPLSLAFDLAAAVILPKVLRHIDRLRSLTILGNSGHILTFPNVKGMISPLAVATGRTALRALSLRFQGSFDSTTRITEEDSRLDRDWHVTGGEMPALASLETLELEGVRVKAAFFPQLVSLAVHEMVCTVGEFNHLFKSLPLLRSLTLYNLHVFDSATALDDIRPLIVPNLDFLSLSFTRRPLNSSSPYPVSILQLPNLSRLELDGSSSVPICSCLDSTFISAVDNLQTLRLSNYSRFSLDSHSESTWSDINLLRRLTSICRLELINTPFGQLMQPQPSVPSAPQRSRLGWRPRATISPQFTETSHTLEAVFQRMRINANPASGTSQLAEEPVPGSAPEVASATESETSHWPALEELSIDSMSAEDVLSLCRYVSGRTNTKIVRLSSTARRHLSNSVKRRIADGTFIAPNSFITGSREASGKETTHGEPEFQSGQQWLQQRVTVLPFRHELYSSSMHKSLNSCLTAVT